MKIGIDVNMSTNIAEGYLIAEFKKRELFTKGKLNPNVEMRFFAHLPDFILEEIYGTAKPVGVSILCTDVYLSANDLWEMYEQDKCGIDSVCGITGRIFPENEWDMLNLAADINAYKGLSGNNILPSKY